MICTDTCHEQPLGEVLHSMEICFVTSLLNDKWGEYHLWEENLKCGLLDDGSTGGRESKKVPMLSLLPTCMYTCGPFY